MPCPRRLRPWLASLLGLGWLLSLALPGVHAGAFRVAEMRPRDPRAAALWQHPQVAQAVRVWSAVATELFRLPTDITVTPPPVAVLTGSTIRASSICTCVRNCSPIMPAC